MPSLLFLSRNSLLILSCRPYHLASDKGQRARGRWMESVRHNHRNLHDHHCVVDADPSAGIGAGLDDGVTSDTVPGGPEDVRSGGAPADTGVHAEAKCGI